MSHHRVRRSRSSSSARPAAAGGEGGTPGAPASASRRRPWRRWRWVRRARAAFKALGKRSFPILAAVFFLLALMQRLVLVGFNAAEYTDGILMIGRDLFGATYWPPLYTWASRLFAFAAGGDLEVGGQLVSAFAGAAAVIPILYLAGEFGAAETPSERREVRALAGLLYLVSPIAWRWGIRVMSDALFLFLWWSALALLAVAWQRWREGRGLGAAFVAANVFGALSALTRHQGIFMLPLVLLLAAAAVRRPRRRHRQRIRVRVSSRSRSGQLGDRGSGSYERRAREQADRERRILPSSFDAAPRASPGSRAPSNRWRDVSWGALASLALWAAWPLSQAGQAAAHAGQVTYRASLGAAEAATGPAMIPALVALVNMTESFVYLAPYFFTPAIWFFAIVGVVRRPGRDEGGALFGACCLVLAAMVLGAQGLFQSFLSRYLLPLLPIVVIYAARGLAWAQSAWKRPLFLAALGVTLGWGLLFSLASLTLQREAFGDLRAAAELVRGMKETGTPLFSNETYKEEAGLHAIKVTWWAGREARPLHELLASPEPPVPGTLVVLSSAYGGPEAYLEAKELLERRYGAMVVGRPFEASLVPLLPDIMMGPEQGHQSPVAWVYRFTRQRFQSVVLRLP